MDFDFSKVGDSLNKLQGAVKEGDAKILANQKAQALYQKATKALNTVIVDTVDINRKGSATKFGKWLNKISIKHPILNKVISPVRSLMYNLHTGSLFNHKEKIRAGVVGNVNAQKATGIFSWGPKLGKWLSKKGPVGQFIGKALKNPVKGPLFMAALVDGVMSVVTAAKDVVQVTKKEGILAGLWAGTKSLAKSAVGIGTGLLAAGATALMIGTGPIGLVVGTVAYIAGSYLGNKVVGAVLPAQDKPEPKGVRPFSHVTPYPYRGPSLDLTVDEIIELGPEGLSEHLQARVDDVNRRKFTR